MGAVWALAPVSLTAPAHVPKPQHRPESRQALLALQAVTPQPLPLPAPRPPGHSPNIWSVFPASWGAGAGSQEGPVCGTVWECHHWGCDNQRVRGRSLAWLVGGGEQKGEAVRPEAGGWETPSAGSPKEGSWTAKSPLKTV